MRRTIAQIIQHDEAKLLDGWLALQPDVIELGVDRADRRESSRAFLRHLLDALDSAPPRFEDAAWDEVRGSLAEIAQTSARRGMGASETARFVLSLKQPLFDRIARTMADDPRACLEATLAASRFMDQMGLFVLDEHAAARAEFVDVQRDELAELSCPVVEIWPRVLVLPLIGLFDALRAQQVMETLLGRIVEAQAEYALVDIAGVPAVDTVTAQHLLKMATAVRLVGSRCVLSGMRPQVAQTLVGLDVHLGELQTHANLPSALEWVLEQEGGALRERGRGSS